MRRFWLAVFFLVTLLSIGPAITDEQRQLLGLHNLALGSVHALDVPPEFFESGSGFENYGRAPEGPGVQLPAHSPLLDFAALPLYILLDVLDGVVPVAYALVAFWGVLAYGAARIAADWIGRMRGVAPPPWTRPPDGIVRNPIGSFTSWLSRTTPRHRYLLAIVAAVTGMQLAVVGPFNYDVWGAALAIQLTSVLLAAASVVAFHAFLQMVAPRWAADAAAGLLLTATPLAFWGTQSKYHGVMMALVVLAMALFTMGWLRDRWRLRAAAIALGGLAVWNHLSGVILVAGLGMAELVHARWPRDPTTAGPPRTWWRSRARSHALAALALLVGLVPFLVYNSVVFGNPLTDGYVSADATDDVVDSLLERDTQAAAEQLDATQDRIATRFEHQLDQGRWGGRWEATKQVFLLADAAEGNPLAVLTLTPVLILALLSPLALRRGMSWTPAATMAITVIVVNWFVYVLRGPHQGAGYDMRYFSMSVPPLVMLATMGLVGVVRDMRSVWGAAAAAYVIGAVSVFSGLLVFAHKNFLLDWKQELHQTYVVMRVLGITAYAMLPLAALGRPWLGRFQQPVLGAFLGLGLLNSHLWVFTTQVIFHTGIPAHGGYPAFNHVVPLTHWLHELAVRWLIPPKWGVAG